jgi:hypothetical protein
MAIVPSYPIERENAPGVPVTLIAPDPTKNIF